MLLGWEKSAERVGAAAGGCGVMMLGRILGNLQGRELVGWS